MGARSAAASFRSGLSLGQRDKEFTAIQGLRERQFAEDQARFETGTQRYQEGVELEADRHKESTNLEAQRYKAEKERKDKEWKEDVRRWNEENKRNKATAGRDKTRFGRETEQYNLKKKHDVIQKRMKVAEGLVDLNDEYGAGNELIDIHNKHWVSDDEANIMYKSMDPDNPVWQKPEYKDYEIIVTTKKGGHLPVKNIKEFMKFASKAMGYEQYAKDAEESQAKLVDRNNSEKPFTDAEGTWIQTWKLESGHVVKDEVISYTEPTALTGGEKKAAEAGLDVSKLGKDEKEILAGSTEKKKQPAPGEGGTKALKAQTEQFKKDMDMLLRHFAKGGTMLLVDDEGNLSKAGKSALSDATELWNKQKRGDKLTPEESSKLSYARDAVQVYEVMQQAIKARYVKPGAVGKGSSWEQYNY